MFGKLFLFCRQKDLAIRNFSTQYIVEDAKEGRREMSEKIFSFFDTYLDMYSYVSKGANTREAVIEHLTGLNGRSGSSASDHVRKAVDGNIPYTRQQIKLLYKLIMKDISAEQIMKILPPSSEMERIKNLSKNF